jgi:hypothetical protein
VTDVRVSRLNHKCSDGAIRQYTRDFPRRIKIDGLRTGKYVFFDGVFPKYGPGLAPGVFFVSGDLRRSVRRVTGGNISSTIRFASGLPSGETACVADASFMAAR